MSDNGIGLGEVDMERLFTLSYTTKATGTGVGLSISRSIIEAHGGQLWAEPRAPRGAAFSFMLPVAPPASATRAAIEPDTLRAFTWTEPGKTTPARKPK